MAKARLLDHNQISGEPRWHLKLKKIKKLVTRGLAFWIVEDELARMVSPDEIRALYIAAQTLSTPWEPIEIPGLHFEEPNIRHNPEAAIVRQFKPVMA
jgi:hypothetical protein